MLKKDIAKQYVIDHPTQSSHSLAIQLVADGHFTHKEAARSAVRSVRGSNGEQYRKWRSTEQDFWTRNDNTRPYVLLLDIETAPMIGYVWGTFKQSIAPSQLIKGPCMIGWSCKWLFDKEMKSDKLTPREAIARDDSRISKSMWSWVDKADVIIGHNCVSVDTPVLKQDLTWVNAGELAVGDKLVGFEEKTIPGVKVRGKNDKWIGVGGKNRKILGCDVTDFSIENRECMEVLFENGDKVVTTRDHYWLGYAPKDNNQRWYKTEKLKPGNRMKRYFNVWETDRSYEAGWLSGFISGEGTLKQRKFALAIDFFQRPGSTWDQAIEYCKILGLPVSNERTQRATGIGRQDTLATGFLGGKYMALEIIGRLRIKRFLEKFKLEIFGGLCGHTADYTKVVSVTDVGMRDVAVFGTTSKTFFGAGYPMHNCDKFDLPFLNSRFVVNGLKPPSPYQTIDTLKVVKANRWGFRFSSNRLDSVCLDLGLPRKIHTDFSLWSRCLDGEQSALNEMEEYNRNDVGILEEVYVKLRPWIKSHPNMGLYNESDGQCCGNCGSLRLEWPDGQFYHTMVGKYSSGRCLDCGAIVRTRVTALSKKQRDELLTTTAR